MQSPKFPLEYPNGEHENAKERRPSKDSSRHHDQLNKSPTQAEPLGTVKKLNEHTQHHGSPSGTSHRPPIASLTLLPDHQWSSQLPEGYSAAFPRDIWQTSSVAGKEKYAKEMHTWIDVKGFTHHWLSDSGADQFVHDTFSATRPSLVAFWDDLSVIIYNSTSQSPTAQPSSGNGSETVFDSTASSAIVLRADLLRYMLMFAHGGVYADIDTSVLVHIDQWIPANLGSHIINAIIGIEYDDHTYPMFVRPISFCQWTLMSKPAHPIFLRAIDRVMSNLEFVARRQRVDSLSLLKLDKLEVLEATGPGMISDVVFEVIRDQLPDQEISWATFHDQKEAKLYGDVLILPINGFAGGQKHSHSDNPEYGEKLVHHYFSRSWYRPKKANPI